MGNVPLLTYATKFPSTALTQSQGPSSVGTELAGASALLCNDRQDEGGTQNETCHRQDL
jgi:hypothetical protein